MLGKLGALSESGNIAGSIGGETAAAFIATFLGVTLANLLWLPIGAKVKARIASVELQRELITEAILMLAAGNSPNIMRQKLQAYILPEAWPKTKAANAEAKDPRAATSAAPQVT